MFKLGEHYDMLVGMIIRPPRFTYHIDELGPRHFVVGGKSVQRTDFELINERNLAIQCSHFEPLDDFEQPRPCVIYLHGNGGGRLDALDAVRTLLPCGISVMALDFTGSGLSDGEYVSLGYWEKSDVAAVVAHLRETERVTTIGLWGRSMGAVTALLYAREDPSVAAMVLDSPFCSLSRVAEELVGSMPIPTLQKMPRFTRFAVGLGMRAVRTSIKKRAQFDVKHLELLEMANECFIPSLFVHADSDTFIRPQHSEDLYNRYGGDKNRIIVDGDHNSMRPQFFMDSAVIFFNNTLFSGDSPRPPVSVPGEASPDLPTLTSSSFIDPPELSAEEIGLIMESDVICALPDQAFSDHSPPNQPTTTATTTTTTTTTAATTTTATTTTKNDATTTITTENGATTITTGFAEPATTKPIITPPPAIFFTHTPTSEPATTLTIGETTATFSTDGTTTTFTTGQMY